MLNIFLPWRWFSSSGSYGPIKNVLRPVQIRNFHESNEDKLEKFCEKFFGASSAEQVLHDLRTRNFIGFDDEDQAMKFAKGLEKVLAQPKIALGHGYDKPCVRINRKWFFLDEAGFCRNCNTAVDAGFDDESCCRCDEPLVLFSDMKPKEVTKIVESQADAA